MIALKAPHSAPLIHYGQWTVIDENKSAKDGLAAQHNQGLPRAVQRCYFVRPIQRTCLTLPVLAISMEWPSAPLLSLGLATFFQKERCRPSQLRSIVPDLKEQVDIRD